MFFEWLTTGPFVRLKALGTAGAALAGVFGGIAGFAPAVEAWDTAGMPTLAMRGFVRSEANAIKNSQAQTTHQLMDVQIDIATGKRDQTQIARDQLELQAAKETDPDTKLKMQQQMRRLDETVSALNEQVRALRGARGPN